MPAFQSVAKVDLKSAVAVWLFDEGSGDIATDFTGNGNDGKLTNGPVWIDGKIGKALKFDGVDDYLNVSSKNGFPKGSDPRTICLWIKWSEVKWPSPGIEVMGYGTNSNGQRLGIWIDSSKALGIETCNYGRVFSWDGDMDWHHLAVAFPAGETKTDKFKLYFDGVLKSGKDVGTVQTLNTSNNPLAIGVLPDPMVYFFNGAVDEVAIFGEELSEDNIKSITKNGLTNLSPVSLLSKLAISWGIIKTQ
jgi:hypothetical protein